jgi:hypothetical protein
MLAPQEDEKKSGGHLHFNPAEFVAVLLVVRSADLLISGRSRWDHCAPASGVFDRTYISQFPHNTLEVAVVGCFTHAPNAPLPSPERKSPSKETPDA